ncbi:LOXE3 isomerase, partial [Brachypteracias leptosomus]|nr:LOXE3 isomerase [Brachypteracias leptosomus]
SPHLPLPLLFLPTLQEKTLTVRCPQDLGPLLLVRLHKWRLFLEDSWFCRQVSVTAPDGTFYRFPCYQWLEGVTILELREGSGRTSPSTSTSWRSYVTWGPARTLIFSCPAKKVADDELEILREHRRRELQARQEAFQWKTFSEGWPRCLNVDSVADLDSNAQFSCLRATNFKGILILQGASHFLSGFLLRRSSWKSLDEMRSIFSRVKGREIGGWPSVLLPTT